MDVGWLRRRWMEFRWGHGTYLTFFLSAINFVLIVYRMLIEYIEPLKAVFTNLTSFVIVYVIVYLPVAILIGRWHRMKQLAIDTSLTAEQNPYTMELVMRLRRLESMMEKMVEQKD